MIAFEHPIMGNNSQLVDSRLGDQHTIERIAVYGREPASRDGVTDVNRQRLKTAPYDCVLYVFQLNFYSSQRLFYCEFPDGGRTHEDVVIGIGDYLARVFR